MCGGLVGKWGGGGGSFSSFFYLLYLAINMVFHAIPVNCSLHVQNLGSH